MLMNDNRQSFDDLIQLSRDPVCQRGTAKVMLLSSEMDFEDVVRKNARYTLRHFPFRFGFALRWLMRVCSFGNVHATAPLSNAAWFPGRPP
jgi:hypothetical protein